MFAKYKIKMRPKIFYIREYKRTLKSQEKCSEFVGTRDPLCYDTTWALEHFLVYIYTFLHFSDISFSHGIYSTALCRIFPTSRMMPYIARSLDLLIQFYKQL